jgi:hypothetical protein
MSAVALTADTFEDTVAREGITLVDCQVVRAVLDLDMGDVRDLPARQEEQGAGR